MNSNRNDDDDDSIRPPSNDPDDSDIDEIHDDVKYVNDEFTLDQELKYAHDEDGEYMDDEEPPPPMSEDDEIDEQYGFVLNSLLFPPHVKEQLMETQTKEKKLMIIDMHKHLLANKKANLWGEQQNSLLNLIRNSKRPDIQVLVTLRSSLASANKDFLTGFLEADGIYILKTAGLEKEVVKQIVIIE